MRRANRDWDPLAARVRESVEGTAAPTTDGCRDPLPAAASSP